MTISELEKLMVKHGLVIRAVPHEHLEILEIRNKDRYPDGIVKYGGETFKRDMLYVTKSNGKLSGKFLISSNKGTGEMVKFINKPYNSISDAIKDLEGMCE